MIRNPFRFYEVAPPPPTYFAGTLPTVNVRSTYPDDYVANAVRQGGSRFFGTVGRFMGQPQRDMMELFTGVEQTPSEYFEIENPYAAFAVDAVTDPVNLIGGAALTRFARLGMAPLRQGIKSSGRYLTRGYGNLSTGNSFIPRAWRSPIENIDQPMSQKFFDETIDVSKLSKEDKKLWAKYQKDSGPYKIPGTKEYDEMQDLISRSSIAFPEGMPLTRMIGFENMTSPINKSGILDVSSPTSFSTGRGQEIIGNIAGEGNRRVVIPPKYAKKLEGYFGKNPYAESLDQPLDLLRQEKEVVGSGFKLKQIGKVKNELGGYDYIMKPINLSKPKQIPSPSKFKSEIDWGKWNPETPKYPELIDEYNAIEESTKKAGTWMKNADGSAFKGTPEQFIQQQSSYFRKAFPNPVRERRPDFFSDEILGGQDPKNYFDKNMPIQINYHSSPNEFDFFDENLFSLGAFGKGIYTSRIPQNMYGKNQYKLYLNANNPQPYSYTRFVKKNGSEVAERVNEPKLVHERTFYQQLEPGKDYFNPAEESIQSVVPFSNYPKSAIGNVGFFDMTNPNIYKSMMPLGAIYGGRNYYRDK